MTDPTLTEDHVFSVPISEYYENGPAGHHIQSFNAFLQEGISTIMEIFTRSHILTLPEPKEYQNTRILEVRTHLRFYDPKIEFPTDAGGNQILPNHAIKNDLRYAGQLITNVEITTEPKFENGTFGPKSVFPVLGVKLGDIPILTRSDKCCTSVMTADALDAAGEDPYDQGGIFIVGGTEKIVQSMENIAKNTPTFHLAVTDKEVVRCEVLSQAGIGFENSSQTKMLFNVDGSLMLEIVITMEKTVVVPFYIIFRAFGVLSDQKILEYVVGDLDNDSDINRYLEGEVSRAIAKELNSSFDDLINSRSHSDILVMLYNRLHKTAGDANRDTEKFKAQSALETLDMALFPHMGLTPEARGNKLMYAGYLIKRMLMVAKGIYKPTDRDHFAGKDVYPSGPTLAKSLKSNINVAVIVRFRKTLLEAYNKQGYDSVNPDNIFRTCFNQESLSEYLRKALSSGIKEIKISNMSTKNRMQTVTAEHKNHLNIISSLRTIAAAEGKSSATSDRSIQQRSIHNSFPPFIDPMHGIEGAKVGLEKQMSIGCSITQSANPVELKRMLEEDTLPLRDLEPKFIEQNRLYKCFVNGEWIGCTNDSLTLAAKYRNLRRRGLIDIKTSIYVDTVSTGEVNFRTSMGRLCYPMVIVYNNEEEYRASARAGKPIQFHQWVKYTSEHSRQLLAGEIKIRDLVDQQIVEYITVQEIDNCRLAENIGKLRHCEHDVLNIFTHVVSDAGGYGVLSLAVPFAHKAQPIRSIYETKQIKQALGCGCINFPNRFDKGIFSQYFSQYPVVGTIGSIFGPPNGMNILVMIQTDGNNQEDSVTTDRASKERGLFSGAYLDSVSADADTGEKIGAPPSSAIGKLHNDFSQTDNGVVRLGTVISSPNTVLIGRFSAGTTKNSKGEFEPVDNSITYGKTEPGRVTSVFVGHNSNNRLLVKVQTANHREPKEGEKYSARSGNKAVCSRVRDEQNSYMMADGRVPDMILNPHAMPSRMVLNQLLESVYSAYCAKKGIIGDATIFRTMDINQLIAQCIEMGIKVEGDHVYDGMTGRRVECKIFSFMCTYQRLKKFAIDDANVVGVAKRSALTGQPVKRVAKGGGVKEGEMEIHALSTRGAMATLNNVAYQHSDGLVIPVCKRCGSIAAANPARGIYLCKTCADDYPGSEIALVQSSKSTILLYNHINAANCDMKFSVGKPGFEFYE
jgi:DNA-directed RNA polymerase beta subunit